MPIVEETGLIIPLGESVLEEAYRQVVARFLHLTVPL
jgi:EAL domain-containing protein (putative c-di-GMP-specific phosphodiesterase class I)